MGAWGTGIYENDGAADWVLDLVAEGTTAITRSLDITASGVYVEAPEGPVQSLRPTSLHGYSAVAARTPHTARGSLRILVLPLSWSVRP